MVKKYLKKNNWPIYTATLMMLIAAVIAVTVNALTDTTRPTITQVSPTNNEKDLSTNKQITIKFSEAMDPSTINTNTVTVMQRTTPESGGYRSIAIEGTVTYEGLVATFTPKPNPDSYNALQPSQEYGNVFTVTVTDGVKDLAGNSLSQDYSWSFTTGTNAFNTDATTSQLDQSPTTTSGSQNTPTDTQQPVAAAPITTSTFPWIWVIGGLLALLLVVLLFALFMKPTRDKNKKIVESTQIESSETKSTNYFGDVHPVMALEGIGPKHNKALVAMGIKNTKQLWEADPAKVAYKAHVSIDTVQKWQHMADLARIKDVGPQYAELLERSGVHSVEQLKNSDPKKLLKLVRAKQDSLETNIQGNTPGYPLVENWIEQAQDNRLSKYEGETT